MTKDEAPGGQTGGDDHVVGGSGTRVPVPRRVRPGGWPWPGLCEAERRRRLHRVADRMIGRPDREQRCPGTFGLSGAELRRHANALVVDERWSVAEVCSVLAVTPRRVA